MLFGKSAGGRGRGPRFPRPHKLIVLSGRSHKAEPHPAHLPCTDHTHYVGGDNFYRDIGMGGRETFLPSRYRDSVGIALKTVDKLMLSEKTLV